MMGWTHLTGTTMSLVSGDPGVPMSHTDSVKPPPRRIVVYGRHHCCFELPPDDGAELPMVAHHDGPGRRGQGGRQVGCERWRKVEQGPN
jgi:hypothetical protein